jgi:hypothetical protein
MNYTWNVTNLYTVTTETEVGYVVNAMYEVKGTEEKDNVVYTSELSNSASFEVKENLELIAYQDLTNDIVIGWIQEQLGEDGVNNLQASVAGMINSQINPPVSPINNELPTNFNL